MPGRSLIRGLTERSRMTFPFLGKEAGEWFVQVSLSLTPKPTTLKTEYCLYDGLSPTHSFLGSAVD